MAKDIKQKTNYNFSEGTNKTITAPDGQTHEFQYVTIEIERPVYKLGYCCDQTTLQFPIFINNEEVQIGKTGMLEYQEEDAEDGKKITLDDFAEGVKVELPFHGAADYCNFNFTQTLDQVEETGT